MTDARTPAEPRPADGEMIENELKGLIELLIERVIAIANHIPPPDDKAAELMMAATTARSFLHRILAKHHSRSAYNPNERLREALELILHDATNTKSAPGARLSRIRDYARSALSPLPQGEE